MYAHTYITVYSYLEILNEEGVAKQLVQRSCQ